MKSRVNRVAFLVLSIALSMSSMTSCGKQKDPMLNYTKEELVEFIEMYQQAELDALDAKDQLEEEKDARIAELEEMLKGIKNDEVKTSGITEFSDGTGRITFRSVNDMIKLPSEFNYPGSVQAAGTTNIVITDAVKLKPNNRWFCKMSGASAELQHSNGVSFIISVGSLDRDARAITNEEVEQYIREFFSQLPPDTVKYSRIHVKDMWMGTFAQSHTFIDEGDAQIRCGLIGYGDISIQFMAVYVGEQDLDKDEIIMNLINSIQIWNDSVSIS